MDNEDQKKLDCNIRRAGMFHALRKINVLVKEDDEQQNSEATATKIALGIFGVIGLVALILLYVESNRVTSSQKPHISSSRMTIYVGNWTKQVHANLSKNCINVTEAGTLGEGVTLSTSIMKDGTIEKIEITKSSGNKELDDYAVSGVLASAPFTPFPPEIKRDTDIVTITRSFRRVPCP